MNEANPAIEIRERLDKLTEKQEKELEAVEQKYSSSIKELSKEAIKVCTHKNEDGSSAIYVDYDEKYCRICDYWWRR